MTITADSARPRKGAPFATLPYGVGKLSPLWFVLVVPLLALVLLGIYAYYREYTEGMIITGMRDLGTMGGAPWGLYIAFVIYLVGVSFAGITVAALIRLLRIEHLRPVSRMAELLTVIALMLAAMMVVADLGQPLRGIVNLFRYARPQSPFFGTFSLVISGYLVSSLIYLYLAGRRDAYLMAHEDTRLRGFYRFWAAGYRDTDAERARHERASLVLAVGIIPLLIIAHSTLGLIFGLSVGRPGWFSALQPPGFVVMAGVSGVGHLIVLAAIFRRTLGERVQLDTAVFRWLGIALLVLILVYVYFNIVEMLTAGYSGQRHEEQMVKLLLVGDYAPYFWAAMGSLLLAAVLLGYQVITSKWMIPLLVASGVLVNLAAIVKRILIVVPSQTQGALLPYETGSYTPTWVEVSVVLGALALGALLFIAFSKVFPIMEIGRPPEPAEPAGAKKGWISRSARGGVALGMVATGLGLMAVSYLFLAAPWGFPPDSIANSNPRLPFAPTLFITGVILTFLSAVFYEVWPERKGVGP